MPYKEKPIEKQYFSIGEVGQMFDVTPSLLRYYEQEFELLRPRKTQGGTRRYSLRDLEIFKLIFHLVKERGYTLEGAREMLKHNSEQQRERLEIIRKLERVKKFLEEVKDQL